jgi:hypothetical protein
LGERLIHILAACGLAAQSGRHVGALF